MQDAIQFSHLIIPLNERTENTSGQLGKLYFQKS